MGFVWSWLGAALVAGGAWIGSALASPGQGEAALLNQIVAASRGGGVSAAPYLPVFVRGSAPSLQVRAPASASLFSRRELEPVAEAAASAYGVDVRFFKRLIRQESGYNPAAVSSAGAQGIAQFMPATAVMVGLDNPFDPHKALPKSAELLASLHKRLGNEGLAAAAYNAGEGRVRAWLSGRSGLPLETQHYVLAITGKPAHEWAPAGLSSVLAGYTVSLTGTTPRPRAVPIFADFASAEWRMGAALVRPTQPKLTDLLSPAAPRSNPRPAAASLPRPAFTGERALCASLGCIVSAVY